MYAYHVVTDRPMHVGTLEHHTSVELRKLALEEVRQKKYPHYPSGMGCLYVSKTFEEADNWGKFFAQIGRPTYHIVKLEIEGNCFVGDVSGRTYYCCRDSKRNKCECRMKLIKLSMQKEEICGYQK